MFIRSTSSYRFCCLDLTLVLFSASAWLIALSSARASRRVRWGHGLPFLPTITRDKKSSDYFQSPATPDSDHKIPDHNISTFIFFRCWVTLAPFCSWAVARTCVWFPGAGPRKTQLLWWKLDVSCSIWELRHQAHSCDPRGKPRE